MRVAAEKGGGRPDDFALFVVIDRACSRCKSVLIAEPYFGEDKAFAVQHNEVNFTHSTAKVCCNFRKATGAEMIQRKFLRLAA